MIDDARRRSEIQKRLFDLGPWDKDSDVLKEMTTSMSQYVSDAVAAARREERERCAKVAVDEYNDALRNGLDHVAAYRCMLAALRAGGPSEGKAE